MSDVMLFGVLRMPYEMAMGDELSRRQYWDRGQQAADEIERLRAALREAADELDAYYRAEYPGDHPYNQKKLAAAIAANPARAALGGSDE